MNLGLRMSLIAILTGLLLAGWYWIASTHETPGDRNASPRWQSSRQCKECHEKQYSEWQGSHHQIAYSNPEVRRLSDDFRVKDCQACHLPRPVAVTGFGKRTLPRRTHPLDGVGCLACHLAADGGILARRSNEQAPCRPRVNATFASAGLCESCHNQHGTTDQWRASPQAAKQVGCNDCHMRKGGHRFPGAHDPKTLREAAEFVVHIEGTSLQMTLRNTGAGHNFPTEERHRAVDIEYSFVTADGSSTDWNRAWRFRQPYRDEPGDNTQLPSGMAKTVSVEIPRGTTRARTRVWYRRNPYAKDGDAASTLLFERDVDVR